MADIDDLSVTDANNTGRWTGDGMFATNLDDAGRADEGILARYHQDTNGSLVTTGAANAYLLAPNRAFSAYAQGMAFRVEASFANTGAVTLNVSSLGAKSITTYNDRALIAGDIEAGQILDVVYEAAADAFQLLSPVANVPLESADIGSTIQAFDADILKADTSDNLTAGFTNTAHDYGAVTTGTVTVDFTQAAQAKLTNNGAFTLAPPATTEGGQDILITNAASAGAITTSGFDDVLGDSFDTTDTNKFLAQVRRINATDILIITALQ